MSLKRTPTLQERGFFWWNEEPLESRHFVPPSAVGGQLTIEGDHILLELDGLLPKQELFDIILMPVGEKFDKPIQGILSPSRRHVLLVEMINNGGHFLAFDCLLANAPFPVNALPKISSMTIDLEVLHGWIQSRSFETRRTRNTVTAKYRSPKKATYEFEGEKLEIEFNALTKRGDQSVTLSEHARLTHSFRDAAQLDQQYELFGLLNDFFVLLTGSNFNLPRPTLKLQDGPACEWHLFRGETERDQPIGWTDCWTTFPTVRTQLGDLWRRWVQLHKRSGAGVYLYLSTLRRKDLYPEHSFANLVWGLEAFHRKKTPPAEPATPLVKKIGRILNQISLERDRSWLEGKLKNAHEPALAERIAFLIKSLPIGLDPTAVNKFAKVCADLRNEISHYGGNKDALYLDFVRKLERFGGVLSTLYHCLILHEIGVDPKHLDRWINEGRRSHAIRHAFIDVGLMTETKPRAK
ncbi:HEPN domain-containing protein [Bradyrhizobium sp. USDA 4506]